MVTPLWHNVSYGCTILSYMTLRMRIYTQDRIYPRQLISHFTNHFSIYSHYSLTYKMPLIGYKRKHFKALMAIAKSVQIDRTRTLNAQNRASLYCLPVELISHVCRYLPIAETFCLVICCVRFWHCRTSTQAFIRVQQLLDATSIGDYSITEVRFHVLRLM